MSDTLLGIILLALRIAVVVALYSFLFRVVRTIRAELQASARRAAAGEGATGVLEVMDCDGLPALAGAVFPLRASTSIGRDRSNTIPIPDDRVSAHHARLVWSEGAWWIEDLGSTNGTIVNGRRLTRPARLGRNDLVKLGPATLRVRQL